MNNELTIQQESPRNRDRFSWLGVWDVTKFWWPVLKWEFWILLGYTLLVSVLAISIETHLLAIMWSLAVAPIAYAVMFASSLFGLKSMRERFITLPALNSEKLVFTLLWTFVVIPCISELIVNAVFYLYWGQSENEVLLRMVEAPDGVADMSMEHMTVFKYWSVAIMMCGMMSRSHNIIKGIGFSLLVYTIPSFLIGLLAGLVGYSLGKKGALTGNVNVEEAMNRLFDSMGIYLGGFCVVMLIYFVVMLTLYIRKFAKRQG